MARAINILDGVLRLDVHLDRELLQSADGLAVGLEGIDEFDQAVIAIGHGGVADFDLLIALAWNREDFHLQEVVADVLEQTGVEGALHDGGVDLPGLGGFDQLAGDFLAVYPHGKFANAGALGNRENIGGFQVPVGVIAEGLLQVGDGHLILDGNADVMVEHCQGRHVFFLGNEDAARLRGRAHQQSQHHSRQNSSHNKTPFV